MRMNWTWWMVAMVMMVGCAASDVGFDDVAEQTSAIEGEADLSIGRACRASCERGRSACEADCAGGSWCADYCDGEVGICNGHCEIWGDVASVETTVFVPAEGDDTEADNVVDRFRERCYSGCGSAWVTCGFRCIAGGGDRNWCPSPDGPCASEYADMKACERGCDVVYGPRGGHIE